jgi:choline-sulfatase
MFMRTRSIVRLAFGVLWITLTVQAADKRPNILFIIADDQAPHSLKAYGNTMCQTPHIDRLATEGMVLDGAHHMGAWAGGVCTPSRHMIMSGRTVWHIPDKPRGKKKANKASGRNPNEKDPKLVPPDLANFTMAAVFNRGGYQTVRTCKNGNSYEAANKLFSIRHDGTRRGGTAESGSAWHTDQVLNYLNDRAKQTEKKPFLIYFGFSHPHDPRDGTPPLLAKYGAVNKPTPKTPNPKAPPLQINYLPAHPFHHGHPGLRDEENVQGVGKNRDEATIRNELGREYACIENVDIQIGRVLAKLEAMGELDSTYIFFTSDHGIAVGRHGLTGKQNLYEHTWRVPFIVRGPGIKAGSRSPGNIYLLDVLPTLCDLAGIDTPKTVEGLSFRSVLEGKKQTVREVLYGVYAGGTKPGMRSIKRGKWKLIKYNVLDGKVKKTQLFNLEQNPDELLAEHHDPAVIKLTGYTPKADQRNLADEPKYAAIRREMEDLLREEQKRLDDPYSMFADGK